MKSFVLFCVVLVALVAVSEAASTRGTTRAPPKTKPCIKDCAAAEYKPVCGGDGTNKGNKSFGSECVLSNYNCENGQSLKIVSTGECPGGGGIRLQ